MMCGKTYQHKQGFIRIKKPATRCGVLSTDEQEWQITTKPLKNKDLEQKEKDDISVDAVWPLRQSRKEDPLMFAT
jgi:hypothetical protein